VMACLMPLSPTFFVPQTPSCLKRFCASKRVPPLCLKCTPQMCAFAVYTPSLCCFAHACLFCSYLSVLLLSYLSVSIPNSLAKCSLNTFVPQIQCLKCVPLCLKCVPATLPYLSVLLLSCLSVLLLSYLSVSIPNSLTKSSLNTFVPQIHCLKCVPFVPQMHTCFYSCFYFLPCYFTPSLAILLSLLPLLFCSHLSVLLLRHCFHPRLSY